MRWVGLLLPIVIFRCYLPLHSSCFRPFLVRRFVRQKRQWQAAAIAVFVVITITAVPSSVLAASLPSLAGKSLIEALSILQEHGLKIVFSDAVVTPTMVVFANPSALSIRLVLDEILAPHNLAAKDVPGGVVVVVPATKTEHERTGTVRGIVTFDFDSPFEGPVLITIVGGNGSATVGGDGSFILRDVPEGEYTIEANAPGLLRRRIDHVTVRRDQVTNVIFHLDTASVFLSEIVVTPSHFKLLDQEPESRLFLSREEVDQMPHVADDLYRAVKRLPGASSGDYSAKFNVRGGEQEELLVMLDGLELYEPFHLKDFQSIFSVVDTETVGGVDFLTGGFPAEYGDRMSGVMDISTLTPEGPTTTTIGVSTINSRIISEGSFNDDRGQWLVNARIWYPDTVVNFARSTSSEVLTDYYDCLAKVQYRIGSHSLLSGNVLFSYDNLGFATQDENEFEAVAAQYRSHHLWFNLRTDWSETVFSQTVLSSGRVKRERTGGYIGNVDGSLHVADYRNFDFVGFKQDWTVNLNDQHFIKAGVEIKRQEALYDYTSGLISAAPAIAGDGQGEMTEVNIDLSPAGTSYGAYVADRIRLTPALVTEIGLRWDRQFYIGDHQISPRINLMYELTKQTTLRAGWGRFYQSQRLNELQVEDGVTSFFPAQLAQHFLASIEHRFGNSLSLRVEAYRKDLSDLRPRFENLFDPLEMFPEAANDRVEIAPDWGRS